MTPKKKKAKFPRSDLRHWEQRVYRPAFKDALGEKQKSGSYHVKIQAHGERRGVSLKDTTVRDAAKSARALDDLITVHGWTRGLAEFRGESPVPRNNLTLGAYLTEVANTGVIASRALRTYTTKVRTIASAIAGVHLPPKMNKFDHFNGGTKAWQELVDAVPLRVLTFESLCKWQTAYLARFNENPLKHASATRTTNSCLRAGKSIFAEKVLKRLPHLTLPDPLPFREIETFSERSSRYRSQISDAEKLLVAGADELGTATPESEFQIIWVKAGGAGSAPEPTPAEKIRAELSAFRKREAFKVLILGLCSGLRRGEIDLLLWTQVDFVKGLIWVTTTDVHKPKADSDGEIHLDPEILALLKTWRSSASSRFVVGGTEAKPGADKVHYRAARAHVELISWLKTKGISSRMPLHTLRKEFGSIVCEMAGIYVASRLLRHANISMTADVYLDDRKKITSKLGSAFSRRI